MKILRNLCTQANRRNRQARLMLTDTATQIRQLLSLPLDAGLFQRNRETLESVISAIDDAIFYYEQAERALSFIEENLRGKYVSIEGLVQATYRQRFFKLIDGRVQECGIEDLDPNTVEDSEVERERLTLSERLFKVQAAADEEAKLWADDLEAKMRSLDVDYKREHYDYSAREDLL